MKRLGYFFLLLLLGLLPIHAEEPMQGMDQE